MSYKNAEGYTDITAGTAIGRVTRKERIENMKKRSCRRTEDENRIHDKAVKIRKMTDEQLVRYVEDRVAKAESEGYNRGSKHGEREDDCIDTIHTFIAKIAQLPGIGKASVEKITVLAKEEGYIEKSEKTDNRSKKSGGR